MNLLRRWPAAMLAAAALSLSVAGPASADNTPFPRRAIIEYGGPFDTTGERYVDQAFRDSIARFDLTILTTWPNFGRMSATAFACWRARPVLRLSRCFRLPWGSGSPPPLSVR